MKEVGDKFGAGELILPFVLQSAEVMKKAVAHLEKFLERKEGVTKGTVVLATVYGDVHDIGKNLVKTILSTTAITVIDLGKQVPAETIITKAVEVKADAIGLERPAGHHQQADAADRQRAAPPRAELPGADRRRGHQPALRPAHPVHRETATSYEPGVFYCKDAFEGLETMDALVDPSQRGKLLADVQRDAEREMGRAATVRKPAASGNRALHACRRRHASLARLPGDRAWCASMPLELVFQRLSKNELFRLSWGAKNAHGEEWEQLKAEFEARLERMTARGSARGLAAAAGRLRLLALPRPMAMT